MKFIKTDLKDLTVIEPQIFGDERGLTMESYHQENFIMQALKLTLSKIIIAARV